MGRAMGSARGASGATRRTPRRTRLKAVVLEEMRVRQLGRG
jgi:hypothetical protein